MQKRLCFEADPRPKRPIIRLDNDLPGATNQAFFNVERQPPYRYVLPL